MSFPSPHFRQKLCEIFECSIEDLGLIPERRKRSNDGKDDMSHVSAETMNEIQPRFMLAASPNTLVGRDALLTTLRHKLCGSDAVSLVALYGLPGVGKTSVLSTLATDPEIRARFPAGVLWAGLGPQPQLTMLLQGWGRSLGLTAEELAGIPDIDGLCQRLQMAVNQQAMLILIDDAWQIEHALVCKIGNPQCGYVMTTRSLALATQFAPHSTLLVPELDETTSMDLLRYLAPHVVATTTTAAKTLVRAVGGLPLALTILGHYLHRHSISGQPRRIRAAVQALQQADTRLQISEPIAPTERPPALPPGTALSVFTAIAISDAMLDENAKQLLRAITILPAKPDRFDEATARAICGLPAVAFDPALDALIDASLIECVAAEMFTVHQVISDYGRMFAHEDVMQRLIAHAVTILEEYQQDYEQIAERFAIINAALEMAAEHDPARYVRGVIAIAPFLNSRSLFAEIQRLVSCALTMTTESASRAALLAHGANVKKNQGDYAQAQVWAEEGITLARTLSDKKPLLLLLNVVSELLIKQGQTRQAETHIREGMAIPQAHRYRELWCRLLVRLAQVEERQNVLSLAETHLQAALQVSDELGVAGRVQASAILTTLGVIRGKQGDFIGSAAFSQQGLTIARQLGYFERQCGLLINMSHALRELGKLDEAETALQEAAAIARERGLQVRLCGIISNLSVLLAERGAIAAAEEYIKEGLSLAYKLGSFERIAGILNSRAHIALLHGDIAIAAAAITEGLKRARTAEDAYFVNTFLCQQGEVCLQENRDDAALVAFQEAVKIADAGKRQHLHAQALYGLARVTAKRGNSAEALRYGQESVQYYRNISHPQAAEVQAWLAALSQNGYVAQAPYP